MPWTTPSPWKAPDGEPWNTTSAPPLMGGLMLGFAVFVFTVVVCLFCGFGRGGDLSGACGFHRWANLGILLALINGCLMCAFSLNVFLFAKNNAQVFEHNPMPYLGEKSSQAVKNGCICMFVEGLLVSFVAGLSFKMVAPWNRPAWAFHIRVERCQIIVLQVWWTITFFATWAARAVLLEMYRHFEGSLPPVIGHQLLGEMATAFIDTFFIVWWCAASTWCRRTEYNAYTCPACDGDGQCKECVHGVQYHAA